MPNSSSPRRHRAQPSLIIDVQLPASSTATRLNRLVAYPRRINDIGRTVEIRRQIDDTYTYEIRQKRYLGRGTYARSAVAHGRIHTTADGTSQLTAHIALGRLYVSLLSVMTLVGVIALGLVTTTILFLPLAILLTLVLCLHWCYLYADYRHLRDQITAIYARKPKT